MVNVAKGEDGVGFEKSLEVVDGVENGNHIDHSCDESHYDLSEDCLGDI
jgi:hypothetical protein